MEWESGRMGTLQRRLCQSSCKAGLFPAHAVLAGKNLLF